jgi:hypothetical protein
MCTCVGPPDTIILGSMGVLIGGKPAARMGDQCAHGGTVVAGCPTVLIGEAGGGGGGAASVTPVSVVLQMMQSMAPEVMQNLPAEVQQNMAQTAALQEAAKDGTMFTKCPS